MSTISTEPIENSSPTLAIKEWCAGEIQWARAYGLTAVISTRLDDEKNAHIRCDVAGGSAFAEGEGEEEALDLHIASFQSFLNKNQDTIRRAYLYGLRRLDNPSERGAHDDDDQLLVSQDLVNLLPHLHSHDLPKMPPDGISYRFAYPEFFQFHENTFSDSQQEDEVDEARLKLPLTRGRKVTKTYLSKILDPEFVPNRPHRSAFWESGSKNEKTGYSRRDFTAELYPIEVTRAEKNYREKLSEIRKRRNARAKSAGRSPSRSSAGSRHSTRASLPSHSGSHKPDQRFGQHLDVPASAPFLPLTQHSSDQLNHHTVNQHIVTPQASAYPPSSGNGPTLTLDGDVWASWPDGTELGTYHTPTSEYNALTDTHIQQITSYVPQVLQTTPQVHGLTDPLPAAQPFLVNRTHLQTMGGPSVDLREPAAADVLGYPTWDTSVEVEYGDYAVNTAGSSFTQSHNTPLSQPSPYQASHSNTRTSSINQWPADPSIAGYLQPPFQYAGSTTYSGYNTHAIGQEPNVPSFDWPPVESEQGLDPNLDVQQRPSHHYPSQ